MTQAACRPYPGMSFVHSDGVNTVVGVTPRNTNGYDKHLRSSDRNASLHLSWRVNILSPRGEVTTHIFYSDEGGPININVAPVLELVGVD